MEKNLSSKFSACLSFPMNAKLQSTVNNVGTVYCFSRLVMDGFWYSLTAGDKIGYIYLNTAER